MLENILWFVLGTMVGAIILVLIIRIKRKNKKREQISANTRSNKGFIKMNMTESYKDIYFFVIK